MRRKPNLCQRPQRVTWTRGGLSHSPPAGTTNFLRARRIKGSPEGIMLLSWRDWIWDAGRRVGTLWQRDSKAYQEKILWVFFVRVCAWERPFGRDRRYSEHESALKTKKKAWSSRQMGCFPVCAADRPWHQLLGDSRKLQLFFISLRTACTSAGHFLFLNFLSTYRRVTAIMQTWIFLFLVYAWANYDLGAHMQLIDQPSRSWRNFIHKLESHNTAVLRC